MTLVRGHGCAPVSFVFISDDKGAVSVIVFGIQATQNNSSL